MGKIKVKIKLEIGFYDSFFFGGGNGLGEIQSYMQKDIQGLPYISGSALKGSMAAYAAVLSDFLKVVKEEQFYSEQVEMQRGFCILKTENWKKKKPMKRWPGRISDTKRRYP